MPPSVKGVMRFDDPLRLYRGGQLDELHIAYETWGTLSPGKDNAILILPGLSPTAHARSSVHDPSRGWWEEMIGPGAPINTDTHYVICLNNLGSCFGSTGPASRKPGHTVAYGPDFPELSIEDLASAGHGLVRRLGIDRLHTLVGPSMGGLSALAYIAQYPAGTRRLLIISSAARPEARAIAIHSLQREAILNDPHWNGGRYTDTHYPVQGMRLARKIGMTSYRAANEWEDRFGGEKLSEAPTTPFGTEFQVESYLAAAAEKFVRRFDPNAYLYLSRAMDWFDVAEHGGTLVGTLQNARLDGVCVIGVTTDTLFPLRQQAQLADAFEAAGHTTRYAVLESFQGHDAFLVDMDGFGPIIRDFI
ncbi:MAG: homoserine O-acetyltransferase [Myxococcota bacterium]|nr:homoserine O-acetyltransferase [Myxococcota bacterium]